MPDFKRYTIVGFDLRQKPLLDLGGPKKLGDYWPTDFPQPYPYPATISEQTWLRSAAVDSIDHPDRNMVRLLFLPHGQMLDSQGINVAFSVRPEDAKTLENGWIEPIDEGYLAESLGWRLLGYDVADAWLAHSFFYGFSWKPGEMMEYVGGLDLTFNRFGLLDDEAIAMRVADIAARDIGTSSHAPFYIVRVWAQLGGPLN